MRDMNNIKDFYLKNYPTDEMGVEINENATFVGLLWALQSKCDVYQYIGADDSIIRERLFAELAKQLRLSYNTIYDLWLGN